MFRQFSVNLDARTYGAITFRHGSSPPRLGAPHSAAAGRTRRAAASYRPAKYLVRRRLVGLRCHPAHAGRRRRIRRHQPAALLPAALPQHPVPRRQRFRPAPVLDLRRAARYRAGLPPGIHALRPARRVVRGLPAGRLAAAVVGGAGSAHVHAAGAAGAGGGAGLVSTSTPAHPLVLAGAVGRRAGAALRPQHRPGGRALAERRHTAGLGLKVSSC